MGSLPRPGAVRACWASTLRARSATVGPRKKSCTFNPDLQHLPDFAQHADRHQRLAAEAEEIVVDADRMAGSASAGAQNLREDTRDDLLRRGPRATNGVRSASSTPRVDQAQRRGQRDPLLLPGCLAGDLASHDDHLSRHLEIGEATGGERLQSPAASPSSRGAGPRRPRRLRRGANVGIANAAASDTAGCSQSTSSISRGAIFSPASIDDLP